LVDAVWSLGHRLWVVRDGRAARLPNRRAAPSWGREALAGGALLDVRGRGEVDRAPEAGLDLADVVLEPAQRVDPVRRDHLAAAPDAHAAAADDAALGDRGAGDHAPPDLDDLADLGAALDDFDLLRLEHAGEGPLDVVGEWVECVVLATVDLLRLARAPGG